VLSATRSGDGRTLHVEPPSGTVAGASKASVGRGLPDDPVRVAKAATVVVPPLAAFVQRIQLKASVAWAARLIGLPAPGWLATVPPIEGR
jgi:hypothetical protein